MNGEQLVDDIVDIVVDTTYGRDWITERLNIGMNEIVGTVLLPGLSGGFAVVSTVVGDYQADMPADFHRELYTATVGGYSVAVLPNLGVMRDRGFTIDAASTGPVSCVCVDGGGKLVYQDTPGLATEIKLRYYRKPALLDDDPSSFTDGVAGNQRASGQLDRALVSYVCAEIFSRIEQDRESPKRNTQYHEERYGKAISELLRITGSQRPRAVPTVCKVSWP